MSLTEWFEDRRKFGGLIMGTFGEDTSDNPIENERENERQLSITNKGKGLWARCDNCENTLHVKFLKQNRNIRDECGYHFPMNSVERIELLIDRDTWIPMDEDMTSIDVLGFVDEDSHQNRINKYQEETGLTDAVQTGLGHLGGTSIALGVMDFRFMGGSMGSVVGEKITRLIEHATRESLPLVIVCASGGARMQEGTLSLMQMAKISSALQNYQVQKRLPYISILTHPTTGGVTASFGMLGDIIIAEPEAYIAFAGKRVIEQTLNQKVPDGLQSAETLFENGLLDLIVPRNLPKGVLSEIFEPYSLAPYRDRQK
uniref:Acetyl-coenzyme A carboxylase carboxyl transferase subunit beta, chloroplastic n=1 Tax=Salvinia cucullata TaxID=32188 RepID=A0A291R854_9MONI|nr:acetyl-CoA carboxylase carboxyltransferase beta subunit [Salvinia cucullata]